jgi:hypothetical protein
MEERLTTQQLDRIVGEVGRLANRRADELDRSQVQSILEELNLPPELLDEAMIQVQRKEALARERKRNTGIAIAAITALVIIAVGIGISAQNKAASIARVTATEARITLVQDGGENLQTVARGSQVAYRVTLSYAPVGDKLNLTCNWLNPGGQIAHTNRFETKNITTPVWNTQCRYAMPIEANTGAWKVQMLVGDKLLKQAPFETK